MNTRDLLERLARLAPATIACTHGSAWTGDGAALVGALAYALEQQRCSEGAAALPGEVQDGLQAAILLISVASTVFSPVWAC